MDDKQQYEQVNQDSSELTTYSDISYETLVANFSRQRMTFTIDDDLFIQACNKLYKIGAKFFSLDHYELLKKYPKLAEEVLVYLQPAKLKAVFGYNAVIAADTIENRLFILSVLQKNGILSFDSNRIEDQDWLRFLTALDPEKLRQFARIFGQIQDIEIADKTFFSRIKSHQDLTGFEEDLRTNQAFYRAYGMSGTLEDNTQIKGFTLINEHVCRRTRQFPKPWKQAMKAAWDTPSTEASFEVYRLYTERQAWLASFAIPIIRAFLSYFYNKPIFIGFNAEPLTELCSLLHSIDELDIALFKIVENIPETALAYCRLLRTKGQLDRQHIQDMEIIPEPILRNICIKNQTQLITPMTLNMLIRLGKYHIDGTTWMAHVTNWLAISELSEKSLRHLGSLEPNQHTFSTLMSLHQHRHLELFEQLTPEQQTDVLTRGHHEKIIEVLAHLQKLELLTPENIQTIFANKSRLVNDRQLYQSIISLDKTNNRKDQKRFNRLFAARERTLSSASERTSTTLEFRPTLILSTSFDEQLHQKIAETLRMMDIEIPAADLAEYSPSVLCAFHAILPVCQEDHLLTAGNVNDMLRFFSNNPQIRCQCMIILSQCGVLDPATYIRKVLKLEQVYVERPALFCEVYAEAWVQTDTTAKWLEQRLTEGLKENDLSENAQETLIQRYMIENEENAAFLALDENKYKIADHSNPPLVQQTIKLLDKSKLKIAGIFDDLLQINEENLQKIYAWLFILNKAELLDPSNASRILQQHPSSIGDLRTLRQIVSTLKGQPESELNTILKQKQVDQMLNDATSLANKQKILDYIMLAIENPSAAAKFAFMASEIADVAGEQVGLVQDQLRDSAGRLATTAGEQAEVLKTHAERLATTAGEQVAVLKTQAGRLATTAGQQAEVLKTHAGRLATTAAGAYEKLKLFTSQSISSVTTPTATQLAMYTAMAQQDSSFDHSYYQSHPQTLQDDLCLLHTHRLLSKPNVLWLVQHPHQSEVSRCLRILAQTTMLQDRGWQEQLTHLSELDPKELSKIEKKCHDILSTKESAQLKDNAIRSCLATLPPGPRR